VSVAKSYAQSLDNFEAFLIDEYKKGIVPILLLLIDEGQNMTRDILKLIHYLLNFETNTEKLPQIVLAGRGRGARNTAGRSRPVAEGVRAARGARVWGASASAGARVD
jgi:hypothetical protein